MNLARKLDLKTKLKVTDIISYFKKNLEAHKKDYESAVKVYNDDMADIMGNLRSAAADASQRPTDQNLKLVNEAYGKYSYVRKPVDAKEMYEEYISIFEASQDEFIELSLNDANAIINDSWDWAIEAKATNSFYSSRL